MLQAKKLYIITEMLQEYYIYVKKIKNIAYT